MKQLLQIVSISAMVLLIGSGCRAIAVNQPLSDQPRFQANMVDRSLVVGVKTVFETGEARFAKYADQMSEQLANQLNEDQVSGFKFKPIPTFTKRLDSNVRCLLVMRCSGIEQKKEKNPFIFAICLPAAFSIVASPIGIAGLSIRGIVNERARFLWNVSLEDHRGNLLFEGKDFETESLVSATGWGTPEKVMSEAFQHTHSEVFAAAVEFANQVDWQSQAIRVAAPEPVPVSPPARLERSGLGRRFAVLVGITEYADAEFSRLSFADDDAQGMRQTLLDGGWDEGRIRLLTNEQATKQNVSIALESWLTQTRPEDLVLLYWSGHGYPDPDDPRRVYFACYDSKAKLPVTGMRMDRVRMFLSELQAERMVLVADTCHAGSLITRGSTVQPFVQTVDEAPAGLVFMVSADADRLAVEDQRWGHGAFTYCLLKALAGMADGYGTDTGSDGRITLGETRNYLRDHMPEETLSALGKALHPLITTSSGDALIWDLPLVGQ